jgi:adenylate cyclase
MNYTIVGDTVNTAQRLEQLGKQLSDPSGCVTAIVSEAIATSLPSGFHFKRLGPVSLHGRAQSVAAYSLHTAEELVDDLSRAGV